MNKKMLLLGLSVLFVLAIPFTQIMACSGFPYFSIDDLPSMPLWVKATVIDADDRGYSAVLRVENYYAGEGEQFLAVMRYPPALGSGATVRGYDTGCLYDGYPGHYWSKGAQGYFGLTSNGDGTFTDENGGTAHFYPVDAQISYQVGAREGYYAEFDEPLTMTEKAFVEKLLEVGGRDEPISPKSERPVFFYPLMRFLTITTEKGTLYQLNPDRSISKLPDGYPLAISSDGAHVAFRVDDQTIAFQYIWTEYRPRETEEGKNDDLKKPGQAIRFSPDSNLVAVWDMSHLAIYLLSNEGYSENYGYATNLYLYSVAQINLAQSDSAPLPHLLWSADSTTIAWEDGSGIWRWDIFSDGTPEQIMTKDEVTVLGADFPALLDVSTYGRYIRVGRPDSWTLFDSRTDQTYDDVLASPTEQFLVFKGSSLFKDEEGRYWWLDYCKAPLRETCNVALHQPYLQSVFSYQMNLEGVIACEPQHEDCSITGQSWHPAIGITGFFGGIYIDKILSDVRQVAYDPQYDQPAILVENYRIFLGFYSDLLVSEKEYLPYLDIVNLEGNIDSPIVSIEWGQPIFFDIYNMTTTLYLPH